MTDLELMNRLLDRFENCKVFININRIITYDFDECYDIRTYVSCVGLNYHQFCDIYNNYKHLTSYPNKLFGFETDGKYKYISKQSIINWIKSVINVMEVENKLPLYYNPNGEMKILRYDEIQRLLMVDVYFISKQLKLIYKNTYIQNSDGYDYRM